jgi:hypothetical protein
MRYKIARWLLNSYLKGNPHMAVPLEEELKEFSARRFSYEERCEQRRAWQNAKFDKLTLPSSNIENGQA